MAVTPTDLSGLDIYSGRVGTAAFEMTQAGDVTTGVAVEGPTLAVAVTGVATAVEIAIERSASSPFNNGARWASAGSSIIINPSVAPEAFYYAEPGVGWWRARLVSITGASVKVDITGAGAN